MRSKVIIFLLSIINIFMILVIIISNNILNKYETINHEIDAKIINKKMDIDNEKIKLKQIKEDNEIIEKEISNIDNYNDLLKKDMKQYEK